MCIWLYAGNPEHPALLAGELFAGSENASGADNQQERLAQLARILRDHTPDIQTPDFWMMIWSPLHGDMQGMTSKEVSFRFDCP